MVAAGFEMLVDHHPLRSVVESGVSPSAVAVQSIDLLAEAMAGSEVLLVIDGSCAEDDLKPLLFSIEGQQVLIAGTSAEYAESEFLGYLASLTENGCVGLRQIDSRGLVGLASVMGTVDAILFDMDLSGGEELEAAMVRSRLTIDEVTRQASLPMREMLGAPEGQDCDTLPTPLLSLLARERSTYECRDLIFSYLSTSTAEELGRRFVLLGRNADGADTVFSTLARGLSERMRLFRRSIHSPMITEVDFTPVSVWDWLNALALSEGDEVQFDTSVHLNGDFARRVLRTMGGAR